MTSTRSSLGPLRGPLATLLCGLALAGCAMTGPAPLDTIGTLPIIEMGGRLPKDSDYVVHYPKGYILPVTVHTHGSLFTDDRTTTATAVLARDLYLYKYWASHDGKTWKRSHDLIDVRFNGGFDVEGLKVDVELGAK